MTARIDNTSSRRQRVLPLGLTQPSKLWRPIHYLGSKLRQAESIRRLLDELDPSCGPVCDLFAGSGTVSLSLCNYRDVIASDIQEYSRILCSALLKPAIISDAAASHLLRRAESECARLEPYLQPILEYEQRAIESATTKPDLLCNISEWGCLLTAKSGSDPLRSALAQVNARIQEAKLERPALMVSRYFGGVYFSYRQTLCIDSILHAIHDLPASTRHTCLAALLSTASNVVNSVGKQFAQPMRPRREDGSIKAHLIQQMCRDRSQDVSEEFAGWLSRYRELHNGRSHQVIRDDYRQALAQLKGVAVIYADPPYTRDHYSRYYHVLETLCLRDSPEISTTLLRGDGNASRGLYRTDRHQSPFCIKTQAPGAFAALFAGCKKIGVPLLLSYSPYVKDGRPRLMTVDAVARLACEHYRQVKVMPAAPMAHSKLSRTEHHAATPDQPEVFIVCR